MTRLSDAALGRLRAAASWPQFESTRYTVIEEIGRGGMGTVYRAVDDLLQREVALKVPNGFNGADVARRLRTEAGVLAQLEHPGIVPIHDAGTLADGRLFYVMKLVRGQTLTAYLTHVTALNDRLSLFERICEPVAFAHARGLVHRDLKPENIMVGAFGEVLVMDWGAALVSSAPDRDTGTLIPGPADATATSQTGAIGTRGFMAPEQASPSTIDARADVYSLGALLFLLLTSERPPDTAAAERLGARRDLPAALRAVCGRAMAHLPDDRYHDVLTLAADVRRYRANLAVDAHPESLLDRMLRFGRAYRTAILLVVAYLVMRAFVAVAFGR
jgi:serine/threonine protein kinase